MLQRRVMQDSDDGQQRWHREQQRRSVFAENFLRNHLSPQSPAVSLARVASNLADKSMRLFGTR